MPFHIEVLSIGGNFDSLIQEAATVLNGAQAEFIFQLAPERLRRVPAEFECPQYVTTEVMQYLRTFRSDVKGKRPYLIGIINSKLASKKLGNLFGSHESREQEGEAVITLDGHALFSDSPQQYLCYYFIRYALSFVCPSLRNHLDTRSCFFDRKIKKQDIRLSMESGELCSGCRAIIRSSFNEEIMYGFKKMIVVMKSLRSDSIESLAAKSFYGQIDIGIITVREDEFEAVLQRFPGQRHLTGSGTDYQFTQVETKAKEFLRVAICRSPEQGQGAAQAIASSMINDLAPKWLFVVGIAGGFPTSEFTLGDVLLSQRMHDFSVSAAIQDKPPEFQDMGGPMVLEVEKLVTGLKARRANLGHWNNEKEIGCRKPKVEVPKDEGCGTLYGSREWRSKVISSLTKHASVADERNPEFFAAVTIASNTLVKDASLATQWLQNARHASGVEMELGGVCRAARYGDDGATRVLAIRGLSDIVGFKRSAEWTNYACQTAASFASALIKSGILRRR